MLKTKN